MTGEDLRGKVEEIHTLMVEIDVFLSQKGKLTKEVDKLITQIQEYANALFYLIPTGKK